MHATNVPSSLQPTAHGVGVHRRYETPGGAGASRLPQAPEHRGRSAEKCAPSLLGSHRGIADYAALGLATSSVFRNGDADLPGGLRDLVPSPHTWEWCACVCQGALVSFTDLLPLQGSPPFGATSKFLPLPLPSALEGERGPQGSWTATAAISLHCAGLGLWALAGLLKSK